MTLVIIGTADENMGTCEYCGVNEELRPYGINGARICFECAMKDENKTKRQFLGVIKPGLPKPGQDN